MDFIFEELRKEWPMISQAPLIFGSITVLLIVVTWSFFRFIWYKEILAGNKAMIKGLKQQLENATAQTPRNSKPENKIDFYSLKPDFWVIEFGVAWFEKKIPFCMKCNLPLAQSLSATNILHCGNCNLDYPLMYGSKRYPLDEAVEALKKGEIGVTL